MSKRCFKKRDWSQPLNKEELVRFVINTSWQEMPFKVIEEMIQLDYIHRSPCSLSFYNKKKDWNYTEPDTIRWSNHWNFKTRHTKDKIHSKTNISVPDNTWVRAKYDETTQTFIVQEIYDGVKMCSKEEILKIREIVNPGNYLFKPPAEVIERRKNFALQIKEGKVQCRINGEFKTIKKYSRLRIDLKDGSLDRRILSNIPGREQEYVFPNWLSRYPDFLLLIDGKEYTEEMLIAENLN